MIGANSVDNRHRDYLKAAILGGALATAAWLAAAGELQLAALSGGAFTVQDESDQAYSAPGPALSAEQLQQFAHGRSEFHQRWVVPIDIGGNWGRGPTSNGEICTDCHAGNGRGRPPEHEDDDSVSMLVRLSRPGEDQHGGPRPHPQYGDQLQQQGVLGKVPPEGRVTVAWREHEVELTDGDSMRLRFPDVRLIQLAFGPLGTDILISPRVAPPVFGMGLLEAVPEETLLEIARRQAAQGFNGRPNYVWDADKRVVALGRFGWKAGQPTLRQQNAAAFLNDMGITTRTFPQENCPPAQKACNNSPGIGTPEQGDRQFESLNFYIRALAVPARRNLDDDSVARGEKLFHEAQCAVCHVPEVHTGDYPALPQIAHQVIRPYSDLLLHDMGEGLADGRPDYRAGPRDWRTPPLWGIGLSEKVNGNAMMLHDGRARNYAEAILWHGGEAAAARETFRTMPKQDREALLAFLASL
ncbi:MAG: di-heme oxidoreductase family protein [Betaproteobacteria bacterium]